MGFLEFLKYILSQTPRVLMGVFLFCLFAIFAPLDFFKYMGLFQLRNEYLSFLWVASLSSFFLLFAHGAFSLFPVCKSWFLGLTYARKRKKRLHQLSSEEKKILRGYIKNDTRTRPFSIFSGVIRDLESFQIIYQASDITTPGRDTLDYNIALWAWDYLRKHPELLKPST